MPNYVGVFTGDIVEPREVSYNVLTWDDDTTPLQTVWPFLSVTADGVLARINELEFSSDESATGTLILPPADQVGVGQDILFNNTGLGPVGVYANGGVNFLALLAPGEVKYFYLTDNSTDAGLWTVFTFGTGTSAADAMALAGPGLFVVSGQLTYGPRVIEIFTPTANFGPTSGNPGGQVYLWRGGSFTGGLMQAAIDFGNPYAFGFRNQGSGVATFETVVGDTIDGVSQISINPGDSAWFYTDGLLGWYTIGLGEADIFAFSTLVKDLTASTGIVTLTSIEAASKIIQFVGLPGVPTTVRFPAIPSVYWVTNQTPSYITLEVTGGVSNVIVAPLQSLEVVVSGTSIYPANTFNVTFLSFAAGSETSPSIFFVGESDTGFFHTANPGEVGFTAGGVQALTFSAAGIVVTDGTDFSLYGPGFINLAADTMPAAARVELGQQLTDAVTSRGFLANSLMVQDGGTVLVTAIGFSSEPSAAGTVPVFDHFRAINIAGVGGATLQTAFRGMITSAAGRWNAYMDGTAPNFFAGQTMFAAAAAAPDAAACVQIDSTTQGFLPPRMTTAERDLIAAPPNGLLIYNTTTGKFNGREAGVWVAFT